MMMKTVLALFALLSAANAFVVIHPSAASSAVAASGLKMSTEPVNTDRMGDTERLLLERKERKDLGLVQKYGKTVKKDGLDGVRAFVWGIFDISNVIFPVMGAALSFGLLLNMAGYGYYFDGGGLVVDTIQTIQQDQMFQEEATKLAVQVVEKAAMF